ncbi:unnamed protein product, partial [Ectocarpus sp. 12 AP-2014]
GRRGRGRRGNLRFAPHKPEDSRPQVFHSLHQESVHARLQDPGVGDSGCRGRQHQKQRQQACRVEPFLKLVALTAKPDKPLADAARL